MGKTHRCFIAWIVFIAGCKESTPSATTFIDPHGRRAVIDVVRDGLPQGTPLTPCGNLAIGPRVYTLEGAPTTLAGWGAEGDPVALVDLDEQDGLDLITASYTGALFYQPQRTPCRFDPAILIGQALVGVARTATRVRDLLYVGWSDSGAAYTAMRVFQFRQTWQEITKPTACLTCRTWGVWAWGSRILLGLDAGEAMAWPALPNMATWMRADPMGGLPVAGHLFVSGLPGRSLYLDSDGVDRAEDAGVAGLPSRVTWGSALLQLERTNTDVVIALTISGDDTSAKSPAQPRILLRDGVRFYTLPVDGPKVWGNWIACVNHTCAVSGDGGGFLIRVSIR